MEELIDIFGLPEDEVEQLLEDCNMDVEDVLTWILK